MDVRRMRDLLQLSAEELRQLETTENPRDIVPPELNDPIIITDEEAERLAASVMEQLDRLEKEFLSSIKENEVLP